MPVGPGIRASGGAVGVHAGEAGARILIDGTTWQNFACCTSADHTKCLQVEPADDVTVCNSTFRMCDTIVVNFANDLANPSSAAGFRAPNNVLIENNVFSAATDWTRGADLVRPQHPRVLELHDPLQSWLQAPRMPDAGDPSTFPGADIDGQARPLGGGADAGADERQ